MHGVHLIDVNEHQFRLPSNWTRWLCVLSSVGFWGTGLNYPMPAGAIKRRREIGKKAPASERP